MSAPDNDGWISWEGGECPVEPGTLVDWRLRTGREFSGVNKPRFKLDWSHRPDDPGQDIVAYRVIPS